METNSGVLGPSGTGGYAARWICSTAPEASVHGLGCEVDLMGERSGPIWGPPGRQVGQAGQADLGELSQVGQVASFINTPRESFML